MKEADRTKVTLAELSQVEKSDSEGLGYQMNNKQVTDRELE